MKTHPPGSAVARIGVTGVLIVLAVFVNGCATEYPGFSTDPINQYHWEDRTDASGGWRPQPVKDIKVPADWLDRRPPDYWFQSPDVWP